MAHNAKMRSPMSFCLCSLVVANLLVSLSKVLETMVIPVVNGNDMSLEDKDIQHMDNVFDAMICKHGPP